MATSPENRQNLPLTDVSFVTTGATWPPPGSVDRLKRYETNKMLWKGDHSKVLTENYWKLIRPDVAMSIEVVFNWHKRLSTLFADLMLSEPPRFFADIETEDAKASDAKPTEAPKKKPQLGTTYADKEEGADTTPGQRPGGSNTQDEDKTEEAAKQARQDAIDRISGKETNGYVATLYEIALDVSRYGDGLGKITLEEDGAQIYAQTPQFWYPVVAVDNLRKITHHVLAWRFEKNGFDFLFVEAHTKGQIQRSVFELKGNILGAQLDVSGFSDAKPYEETHVKDFLIVPFQGLRASDEIFGVDDYSDLDSLIQGIELRAGQIMRILDKHSDPSMYGPSSLLKKRDDGTYAFKAGGQFFPVDGDKDNGEVIPGYVTWDGQLESQFAELDFLVKQLYILSETSPAAFGQLEAGLAESGSALRRLMQAPLAKVARIAMRFDPAAKAALRIAAALETANPGHDCPVIDSVHIQWQDGLPTDPKEQAETEEIRIRSGTSSKASAIRRIDGGTQEEAEAEMERIRDEAENASALTIAEEGEKAAIAAEFAPEPANSPKPPTKKGS